MQELKEKTLLIDGDIVVYRCGFAAEKTRYLVESYSDPGHVEILYFDSAKEAKARMEDGKAEYTLWSRKEYEPLENCLQMVRTSLENIVGDNKYELFLSGDRNFRENIATTKKYKGNREAMQKPKWYKEIKEYLINQWGAKVTDGIEADDALGLRASELGESSCIVSTDKDLDQIPGWHYNWVDGRVYRVSPKQADFAFYTQVLTGDPVDNVPGLEGIGPAKAKRILEGSKNSAELLERTRAAYRDLGGPEWEDFLREQASLVWIRRHAKELPEWLSTPTKE